LELLDKLVPSEAFFIPFGGVVIAEDADADPDAGPGATAADDVSGVIGGLMVFDISNSKLD
jgi:phage/plasmid primase-like uncharacterized protein